MNPGFETGDLTGWTATTSVPSGSIALPIVTVVPSGPATNTNGVFCAAPATCLDNVYNGNYAARIFSAAGDPGHSDWARIEQTDTVPAASPYLSFWFSAVLSGAHFEAAEPYGEDTFVLVEVLQGATLLYSQRFSWYDNLNLLVDDGSPALDGPWRHLPWTQYYYDLSAYVGQLVTVRYTAYDCNQVQHYCWGSIDNAQWLSAAQLPTSTPTGTVTPQPTWTSTPSSTWTLTPTRTLTLTRTLTPTATMTLTRTLTLTPTLTPTQTATVTPCGFPGNTCTPTPTIDYHDLFYVAANAYRPSTDGPVSIYVEYNQYPGDYSLKVFNTAGEQVRDLVHKNLTGPVADSYHWDGRNEKGEPCASGVYLLYLIEPFDRKFKKLVLIR